MYRQFNCWLLVCVLCLGSMGCQGAKLPKTVQVQGKVTWQGKPLGEGTVGFSPVAKSAGKPSYPAIAPLAEDGSYRLASFRQNDGVVPGEYHVTVESYSSRPSIEDPKRPLISRIPIRYTDSEKSGLSFTVPADASGTLVYDIELKK